MSRVQREEDQAMTAAFGRLHVAAGGRDELRSQMQVRALAATIIAQGEAARQGALRALGALRPDPVAQEEVDLIAGFNEESERR